MDASGKWTTAKLRSGACTFQYSFIVLDKEVENSVIEFIKDC